MKYFKVNILNHSFLKKFVVVTKEDFTISSADLVSEKFGKIQRDYTILSPPIGTGIFIN